MSSLFPTTPANTLPPLLRLASELHLEIISSLPDLKNVKNENDLALLQLRWTNRYFRDLVPPPAHSDLLSLELALFRYSVYTCKFCLRLRPAAKFASAMLKGKTGLNGTSREKRFCADCGFDTTVVGQSQRYCPGTRESVNRVDWVWCKYCRLVKKGEEANSGCARLCRARYNILGRLCRQKCSRPPRSRTPPRLEAFRRPRNMLPEASLRHVRWNASDTDSDADDQMDRYDFREEQIDLAQLDDDDWRTL